MSRATETNNTRPKLPVGKILTRTIKMLWEFYPVLLPIALLGAVIQAIMQSLPSVFLERILSIISNFIDSGDWSSAEGLVFQNVALLATFYVIGLLANIISTQGMAIVTQGALQKWRSKMFSHMQDLPIRYFDTHLNGDIMSYYTNDIDAMRQMIGTSLPNLLFTSVVIIAVIFIMFYYSALMAMVVLFGFSLMGLATKNLGGKSAKNFVKTQKTTADVEGHIQEMMNGEKVVKVFSHEAETIESFDKINDELMVVARNANLYANTLMPILNNLGNIMYVVVAVVSGVFITLNIQNVSLSGLPFTIAVAVPFLNMTRQFSAQINQISSQINSVVMGIAGANRVFELLDEPAETEEGYVTLVNAETIDGKVQEAEYRTGYWAWKYPHSDGTVTYTPVKGDVRLFDVDFGYEPGHTVLMIFLFMQNLVRRLPLLAQQVLVKQPLLTCSTASMTLKTARFAMTASTLTRLGRALFVVLSVLFYKTSTSLRVPSWTTSATAVLMLLMRTA